MTVKNARQELHKMWIGQRPKLAQRADCSGNRICTRALNLAQ
jgi:hypothetical protein